MIWKEWSARKRCGYLLGACVSALLLAASGTHRVEMQLTEVLGFITGAWCVWLTVEQNIWNWPIGIANSAFYIAVFLRARLFADMSLQVVYVILGFVGWYSWLFGGEHHTELRVGRTSLRTAVALVVIVSGSTWLMRDYLVSINDSAPFWDALTTTMSLAAQYMLTRKLLENWCVWLSVDVIYVFLYAYKHLYLTSGLYMIFIVMAATGLQQWIISWRASQAPSVEAVPAPEAAS